MLKDEFYTLAKLETNENGLTGVVSFRSEHPIFGGHFPGQPVVPGVCTLQIIKELLEEKLGKTLRLTSASQVKFLRLITPDMSPQVHIRWQTDQDSVQVNASLNMDGDVFKFSGFFSVIG